MFSPKYFQMKDKEEVIRFMEEHSFVTIVTVKSGQPIATHIPVQLQREGENYVITGHLAYANPQWRTSMDSRVLVIYQGPHAYISSSWYSHENVPTWNYQAVHAYGQATLLNEQELQADLTKQLQKYELHREQPVLWETLSSELLTQQLKGIVGFKIRIDDIQATYKLSQNRNEQDFQQIMKQLEHEPQPSAQHIAEAMRKFRRNNR